METVGVNTRQIIECYSVVVRLYCTFFKCFHVSCPVFKINSIDRWRGHGSHCPMCHEDLPRKLLRLFFEPKQEALQAPQHKPSGSATVGTESLSEDREGEHQQQGASSDPEVTRLRRELAAMTKVFTIICVLPCVHKPIPCFAIPLF